MTQSRPQPRAPVHGRSPGETEARIARGARVRGRITGHGDLVIEGQVEGDINVRGDVTIAEGATVHSPSVGANAVTIAGTLEGNVAATGAVRLAPGARVRGDLQGTAVAIDDGARFAGRLDCEFDLPPELGGTSQGETRGRAPARR
jgi:cytoskeletal protein CcmA (bactofilin family)